MRIDLVTLNKKIFYALCAFLPINLGLHFIFPSAYVGGLLIDYLVPTIYIQDLLALVLIVLWLYSDFNGIKHTFKSKRAVVIWLLLYVLLLSTLISPRFDVSFYAWLRWLLYALVSLYVSTEFVWSVDFKILANIVCGWLIFLGILGLLQFYKQSSFFNNYMILGEQPYSRSTPLIDKENIFGVLKVPSYGLFRHPNIFGGIVAIFLLIALCAWRAKIISIQLFVPTFVSGIAALATTFSFFSWFALVIGVVLLFFDHNKKFVKYLLVFIALFIAFSFFIHKIHFNEPWASNPSVYKRIDLLQAGYQMSEDRLYLFGVGLNASTIYIEKYTPPSRFIRFVQPPHNIFVLLLAETGVIALALFVYLFFMVLRFTYHSNYFLFVICIQIILMGCFDHYFLTIHQPFLLLWIILGLAGNRKIN